MKPSLLLTALCVGSALLAVPLDARASATFPEALRNKLGLQQVAGPPPGCQLCHRDDLGGLKTATKPFGRALLKAGAMGGSVPSLLAALSTLEADGTDSDVDGVPDVAELEAGTDPNTAPDSAEPPPAPQVPLPETGCSIGRGPSSSLGSMALMLFLLATRRCRKRPAEPEPLPSC